MFFVELFALVVGVLYKRKDTVAYAFILYIAFDFCILLADFCLKLSSISPKSLARIIMITNVMISYIELVVYYYFFSKVLTGRGIKKMLTRCLLLFSFITLGYIIIWIGPFVRKLSYTADLVSSLEFMLLLPPCFAFYYQTLSNVSEISLKKRPSFWIITGIFFFSITSIPYYLLMRHLIFISKDLSYLTDATLFYTPFTINFIFLLKAFSCKKPLTT